MISMSRMKRRFKAYGYRALFWLYDGLDRLVIRTFLNQSLVAKPQATREEYLALWEDGRGYAIGTKT